MTWWLPLLALALLLAGAICRADTSSTYHVIGGPSCEEWNDDVMKTKTSLIGAGIGRALDRSWLMGYVSGLISADTENHKLDPLWSIDGEVVADWMNSFCAENPKEHTATGAMRLYAKLVVMKEVERGASGKASTRGARGGDRK